MARHLQRLLAAWLAVLTITLAASQAVSDAPPVSIAAAIKTLSANGDDVAITPGREIRLPPRSSTDLYLAFTPFDRETAGPSAPRLLFKLDGVDADWQDIDPDNHHMRMSVAFFEADSRQAGMVEVFMRGKSPGWHGTLAASQFTRRTTQVIVPEKATAMGLLIWSGGLFSTVGVLALDRITVRSIGADGADDTLLADYTFAEPSDAWEKFGSNSDSAVMGSVNGRPVLELYDADPDNYAGWRLLARANVTVSPGQTLDIEWGEIFSIGGSVNTSTRYRRVPPGAYRFRLAAATPEGVPTGGETATAIVVPLPLWNRPWFWAACGLAAGGLLFGTWRLLAWNRMQRRIAKLEQANAVSMERTRIAQDLHDELGASLTQIALASELTKAQLAEPESARTQLDTIFSTARSLARQLDTVVWTISPTQDSVESLVTFLAKDAQHYLRSAGIPCRIRIADDLPTGELSSIERRAVVLAVKEALHNVVQHAGAREVWIRAAAASGMLTVEVEDDGVGMPTDALAGPQPSGHDGLANIRARISGIGGETRITAGADGRGTVVQLRIPVPVGAAKGIAR